MFKIIFIVILYLVILVSMSSLYMFNQYQQMTFGGVKIKAKV